MGYLTIQPPILIVASELMVNGGVLFSSDFGKNCLCVFKGYFKFFTTFAELLKEYLTGLTE